MKTSPEEVKTQVLLGLLSEARAEADGLRKRVNKFEKILRSTRLIMGHELKKPSTAISGYLDLAIELLQEVEESEILEYVKKARLECELLNELNMFFLSLLRVNSRDEELHGRKINVQKFIEKMLEQFPDNLDAKERVKLRISADVHDFRVNPDAFKIIVSNIIENALIYSPEGTPVHIEVEKTPDKRGVTDRDLMKIKVTDHGEGIPKAYLKKIFSPFVRLHTNVPGGAGLGLTLVRSLVELYGGNVYIRSGEGDGTTVYLTLPESLESEDSSFVL